MKELIPFQFEGYNIRIHIDTEDNPWWEAQDVCNVLGIKDTSQAMTRLSVKEKRTSLTRNVLIINESGLYRLIFRSNKPEAQRFQDWVFEDVLPSIRKAGKYESTPAPPVPQVHNKNLQMLIDMAVQLDATQLLAEQAHAKARQADANAYRALETQLFLTVAEYVYINHLRSKLPETDYRACSNHLMAYCMEHNIPVRTMPIGGKRWTEEYAFHTNVYNEAFGPWLRRRFAQANFHVLPTPTLPPQEPS